MWRSLILALLLVPVIACAQTLGISPAGNNPGGIGYTAKGADFDGTNDWLLRGGDLTGSSDDQQGIYSVWLRVDGDDGSNSMWADNTSARFQFFLGTSNNVNLRLENASNTIIMVDNSNSALVASANWYHILVAWDLSVPTCQLYINDAQETAPSTCSADTVDGSVAEWGIGASIGGTLPFNGCISEYYYNQTDFLDMDTEANRRKFNDGTGGSAGGKPVNLGADGSTPTGNQPIVYLNGDETDFQTNQGDGGNFSVTGTLTACSSSPSD